MRMTKSQEKEHALQQARGIIENYVRRGVPELEAVRHGIRTLTARGWADTYYGTCALRWLQERARQLKKERQYRLAERSKAGR